MPFPRILCVFAAFLLGVSADAALAGDHAVRFPLPVAPAQIVGAAERFSEFVTPVREALAKTPSAGDERLVLGMRVHLALSDRNAPAAEAAVAALRSLPGTPEEKAFAGIVTEAQIAAWAPGTTFAHEIGRRLQALPRTPAMTALLQRQRDKLAAITREALHAETEALDRSLAGQASCGWSDADQIVRLHHRLVTILPLCGDLVAALDVAIHERVPR